MISCVLLSACYIENKKISLVGKSNSAFFCGFYRYIYFLILLMDQRYKDSIKDNFKDILVEIDGYNKVNLNILNIKRRN